MKIFKITMFILCAAPTLASAGIMHIRCSSEPIGPDHTTLTVSGTVELYPAPTAYGQPEIDSARGALSFSLSSDPAIPEPLLPDENYVGHYSRGVLNMNPTDTSGAYHYFVKTGAEAAVEYQGGVLELECAEVPGGISSGS